MKFFHEHVTLFFLWDKEEVENDNDDQWVNVEPYN